MERLRPRDALGDASRHYHHDLHLATKVAGRLVAIPMPGALPSRAVSCRLVPPPPPSFSDIGDSLGTGRPAVSRTCAELF